MCADGAGGRGPAAAGVFSSARARMGTPGAVAQPVFPRGHLRARHPAQPRGGVLMQSFRTLVRREVNSFFLSWTGYVIVAAVLFLLGFGFVSMLKSLNGDSTPLPLTQLFYESLYFWIA